jgi:hypothetical protein
LGRDYAWLRIGALLTVAVAWGLLFSPQERSMGTTIRPVYLHVAATVAGMTMLYITAGLGLARTVGMLERTERWLRPMWAGALVMFALGFVLSLLAAQVAWGGVFWAEPRVRASIGVLAVGMVAWAVAPRAREMPGGHMLWAVSLSLMVIMLGTAQRIIHPESPVQDVTPWSIRGTFYGLTAIMFVVSANVVQLMAPPEATSPESEAGEPGANVP